MKELKQVTPFGIDKELWKRMKIQAVVENKMLGKLLEDIIRLYLDREEVKETKEKREKAKITFTK